MRKHIVLLGIFVLGSLFLIGKVSAQDPIKVGGNAYSVKLENDNIRVAEFKLKPGDKVAMHSHPAHFVYVTAPGKLKLITKEGKIEELDLKAGETVWMDPVSHMAENTGTTEVAALVTELKHAKKERGKAKP